MLLLTLTCVMLNVKNINYRIVLDGTFLIFIIAHYLRNLNIA